MYQQYSRSLIVLALFGSLSLVPLQGASSDDCLSKASLLDFIGLTPPDRATLSLARHFSTLHNDELPGSLLPARKLASRIIDTLRHEGGPIEDAVASELIWAMPDDMAPEVAQQKIVKYVQAVEDWLDHTPTSGRWNVSEAQLTKLRAQANHKQRRYFGASPDWGKVIESRVKNIRRFDAAEIKQREIHFDKAKQKFTYVQSGEIVPDKLFIAVMGLDGKIYVEDESISKIKHLSFAALGRLAYAGEMRFANGKLLEVNSDSGHYWKEFQSPTQSLEQLFQQLETQGTPFAGTRVAVREKGRKTLAQRLIPQGIVTAAQVEAILAGRPPVLRRPRPLPVSQPAHPAIPQGVTP